MRLRRLSIAGSETATRPRASPSILTLFHKDGTVMESVATTGQGNRKNKIYSINSIL